MGLKVDSQGWAYMASATGDPPRGRLGEMCRDPGTPGCSDVGILQGGRPSRQQSKQRTYRTQLDSVQPEAGCRHPKEKPRRALPTLNDYLKPFVRTNDSRDNIHGNMNFCQI